MDAHNWMHTTVSGQGQERDACTIPIWPESVVQYVRTYGMFSVSTAPYLTAMTVPAGRVRVFHVCAEV